MESLADPGSFIFAGSGGFMTYSGGRGFDYDAETQTIALHGGKYYMTFDGTAFDQGTLEEACKVLIFGRGEEVVVEKAPVTVPLVELPGADPFEVLSRKLGWAGSSIR